MTQLPRSNATNAWVLLLDVIALIESEPKHLWMDSVCTVVEDHVPDIKLPECGTVGCIAGWMVILKTGLLPTSTYQAQKLLGVTSCYYQDEFYADVYDLFFENYPKAPQGTPEYVAHVVNRIMQFMTKYEARLKAQKI